LTVPLGEKESTVVCARADSGSRHREIRLMTTSPAFGKARMPPPGIDVMPLGRGWNVNADWRVYADPTSVANTVDGVNNIVKNAVD